ncbi:MAG TPA: colanic acid biosynthesis glycosyltransferase WcaL [Ignavibacteria bacterium]|nr:colanic acid biosynthesis glycosyltransferase WcaL [Ignavibacteria bacterium]
MHLLYFLNFYPTKHKIVSHDEMLEMSRRGHNITVIAVWGGKKSKINDLPFNVIYLTNKIRIFSITYLLFKQPVKIINHFPILKKYLGFQDALKYLSSYHVILKNKTDRIHAHFANNAALKGYLFSKFTNMPFSCTGHGSELLLYPEPYLKELITNAKPFITISNYNKKRLIEKYNLSSDQIVVNYCGIDTDYFKKPEKREKPDYFSILSVTALKKVKGVTYLIEACRLLKEQYISFTCQIIGGGSEYDSLFNLIQESGIEDCTTLLGIKTQSEIREYLSISDVFVLPSISEGIPVAVMEAMAMEVPVIASNITGLPEIIEDGISGYLVPPKDPQALAGKIIELYKNPGLCEKFGQTARKTVKEKFNLTKNTDNFIKLITSGNY